MFQDDGNFGSKKAKEILQNLSFNLGKDEEIRIALNSNTFEKISKLMMDKIEEFAKAMDLRSKTPEENNHLSQCILNMFTIQREADIMVASSKIMLQQNNKNIVDKNNLQ